MAKLLVIDNQRAIRKNLTELLENEKYTVTSSDSADECKNLLLKNKYDLVIYNAYMPDMDGIAFLNFLKNKGIDISVIMSADHFDVDDVIRCVREGAYDFIERPCDLHKLLIAVRNALANLTLKKECKKLHSRVIETIPEIMGSSPQISSIKKMIQKVSPCESRVLITGANGTGKELVARWLHELSGRRSSPLVEVNCAAIPNDLIESVLFGHEKGAFTGADSRRIGKFEQADGGTLFLDEIGDMSLAAQAKVLRALQENRIGRVGGTNDIEVNVRVVAATNKNLREEITRGNFREDLYHRLNVIRIHIPSLSERKEDIPQLINQFNESFNKHRGQMPKEITPEAISVLQNRSWTGNIRELQNMIERLMILCDDIITPADVEMYCLCD